MASALKGSPEEFLKILPGKSYFSHALNELGIKKDRFVEIVCSALLPASKADESFEEILKQDLVSALEHHLPPRNV